MCFLCTLLVIPIRRGSRAQHDAVIEVARFIMRNNGFGAEDPENVKSLAAVERAWADGGA